MMTTEEIQEEIERLGPWFYEFDLGPGMQTHSVVPPEVRPIFATRLAMVRRLVRDHFGPRLAKIRCLDVGCHEGFYSVAMLREGVHEVVGVDVREESLERARFVASVLGLNNVRFLEENCEDLSVAELGTFPLTLFLGVLYHLENPMRCLRRVARLTTELCILETQVIDEVEGEAEWGAEAWKRPYEGILALIDESGEYQASNRETGATPVAMCPSPRGLEFMLRQAGFSRVELIDPPADAYEQHQRRRRVVCAAYR
jgi:ubiquinone/menaquinone biosynthesis C-methylase UbiE